MRILATREGQPLDRATCDALAKLLKREKKHLVSDWQERTRRLPNAKALPTPTLVDHIPGLIDELVHTLQQSERCDLMVTPSQHGRQRLRVGFDLAEVVSEYNIMRSCILDLVDRHDMALVGQVVHIVHEIIDAAILGAIRAYGEQRDDEEKQRREQYLKFIVHDLRSPLAAIYQAMMVVENELRGASVSERARAMLSAVQRNIQRMQVLTIKVLQEEANIRTPLGVRANRSEIGVAAVVDLVLQEVQPLALTAGTKIRNTVPVDAVVYADHDQLHRIFQNLISNAIEHSPEGEVIVGAAAKDDGSVECWVADNGRGMPDELKERISKNLPTDARRNGGTGLGLAVVRQFIEAHDGNIDFESKEGDGTTFRFLIPGRSRAETNPA